MNANLLHLISMACGQGVILGAANPFAGLSKECDGRNNWSIRHPRGAGERAQGKYHHIGSIVRHRYLSATMLPVREPEGDCVEHRHTRMFRLPRTPLRRKFPL